MNEGNFWHLAIISDQRLQEGLVELLAKGARTEAHIVAHLAEVDARKLHLEMGASSLFDYCLSRLGLSNNEAFHRITAARLCRKFPIIFEMLERRDVHLTAVCLLRDYLTPENHAELLGNAAHKTKIEIEELLARRFPKANVPNRFSRLRAFEPLSENTYRLQLNASGELKRKLEAARDLMSHANPSGDLAIVVARALDSLLERLQARRFAQAKSGPSHQHASIATLCAPPRKKPTRANATDFAPSRAASVVAPSAEPASSAAGSSSRRSVGSASDSSASDSSASDSSASDSFASDSFASDSFASDSSASVDSSSPGSGAVGLPSAGCPTGSSVSVDSVSVDSASVTPTQKRRAHLRHDVRRAVVERDGQRCVFVGLDGRRCEGRAFLQFHHGRAWAAGGEDTIENLSVVCRAHNRLLAERELGRERVAHAIRIAKPRE